tara:strand:- start:2467 stop:3165 length:699 start_codon:yes stop_codon:yes gene_type:complete
MKIAFCLSGQPRFIEQGYTFFKKNLVGFKDMDIFFHSWENSYKGVHHNLTNVDTPLNILNYYDPINYIIEPQKLNLSNLDLSPEVFIHYSMFYSIFMANKIKKDWEKANNFKYDYVIRSRFDVALLEKLSISEIVKEKSIYSPDVCLYSGVISDWFNFSYSEEMDSYTNIFPFMDEFLNEKVLMYSGEQIFTHQLNKINLDYRKIKCNLSLIRNSKTNTNFWINVDDLKNYL